MAEPLPIPVDRLPTLTEVIDLGRELPPNAPTLTEAVVVALKSPAAAADSVVSPSTPMHPAPATPPTPTAQPHFNEEAVVERVLAALQPRIEGLLEERLKDALAPVLAQAAQAIIRDSRTELLRALRDLTEESLAQVLRGDRPGDGRHDA